MEEREAQVGKLEARLKQARRDGNLALEANLCLSLGNLQEQLGQWAAACKYHRWDAQICEAMQATDDLINARINQAMVFWQ